MAGTRPKLQFALMIDAVVFDLDGVLLQSEEVWDAVRERYVRERGGRYDDEVQRAMMGMSAPEWSRYLARRGGRSRRAGGDQQRRRRADARGVPRASCRCCRARSTSVRRIAGAFPLALASSSNRAIFEEVLELAGIADCFRATVSSEEVARGKPAPDVYLEAARRLGVAPERCAAVEDSHAGIRSAKAAGHARDRDPERELPARRRGARPRRHRASTSLDELTPERIEGA